VIAVAWDKSGEHMNTSKNRRRGLQLGAIVLLSLHLAGDAPVSITDWSVN